MVYPNLEEESQEEFILVNASKNKLKYCLACTNCVFIKVKNVPLTNQKIHILIAKFHKIKYDIDTYPNQKCNNYR